MKNTFKHISSFSHKWSIKFSISYELGQSISWM